MFIGVQFLSRRICTLENTMFGKKLTLGQKIGVLLLIGAIIAFVYFIIKKMTRGSSGGDTPADKPDTPAPSTYVCSKNGQTSDRASCRADINCMWVYKGDPDVGTCKHRVLGPKVDCSSFKDTNECNRQNGQCVIVNKVCTTRPL